VTGVQTLPVIPRCHTAPHTLQNTTILHCASARALRARWFKRARGAAARLGVLRDFPNTAWDASTMVAVQQQGRLLFAQQFETSPSLSAHFLYLFLKNVFHTALPLTFMPFFTIFRCFFCCQPLYLWWHGRGQACILMPPMPLLLFYPYLPQQRQTDMPLPTHAPPHFPTLPVGSFPLPWEGPHTTHAGTCQHA